MTALLLALTSAILFSGASVIFARFASSHSSIWMNLIKNTIAFFGFSLIRAMLWGGLKHRIKGLTLDRTGLMMQEYIEGGGSLQELSLKINEALVEAGIFKEDKDEEPSEGNPPSPAVNTEKK